MPMRKNFLSLSMLPFFFATVILVSSCYNDHRTREMGGSTNTQPEEVDQPSLIEGLPAAQFYDQFTYRREPIGSSPYRYLSTGWLELDGSRYGVEYVRVSLFLLPGHQFILVYHEALGDLNGQELQNRKTLARRNFRGTWALQGTDLLLGTSAIAHGTRKGGQPAVSIVFKEDLHSDVSRGFADTMAFAYNDESLDARTVDFLDTDEAVWFAGKWTLKTPLFDGQDERFQVNQRPREIVYRNHKDVGKVPGSEFPAGVICKYTTYASEVDLSGDIVNNLLTYTLTYRVDRIELIDDAKNHARCGEFVAKRQATLLSRPMTDGFDFVVNGNASGKQIMTRDRAVFEKN